MLKRLEALLARSRRWLTIALVASGLAGCASSIVIGPTEASQRVAGVFVWSILGVLCFAGGYLVPYVQVRNPFAPKSFVGSFCVLGVWFFTLGTLLGWVQIVRAPSMPGAPFGLVAPSAMALGILQVWVNHFAKASRDEHRSVAT